MLASEEELTRYTKTSSFAADNGVLITEMGDDYAVGTLTVEKRHLNGAGLPHGGMYITLADSVFGAATRYIDTAMVTLGTSMEYIASAKQGDTLTCRCTLVAASRRVPHFEARILNQHGTLLFVAHFTGYYRRQS